MKNSKVVVLHRPLSVIADEISKDWKTMPEYARAHFRAFQFAFDIREMYGCDSVKWEVAYFLGNAQIWKGDTARRIKKELNAMIK
jgi:hypothetical protein